MITVLSNTTGDCRELSQFIIENEKLLPDPLSLHVDICGYCKKILLHGKAYLYVTEDNLVSGACMGYMNDFVQKIAHLQVLLVAHTSQKKGIGEKLMLYFLREAKEAGMEEVLLTCDVINHYAIEFYRRIGFIEASYSHPNPNKQYLIIKL